MAQKFISPGVFTTELDQSQLAQGVAGIGAAFVGRTPKGPAFVPTMVTGYDDYAARFGAVDPNFEVPYAARANLLNAAGAVVVRVLGHKDGSNIVQTNSMYPSGWVPGFITGICDASGTAAAQVLLEVHSQYPVVTRGVAGDANNFVFQVVSGTTALFATTASFLTSSANYVLKVLNTDPTRYNGIGGATSYYHYVYRTMRYATPAASASWTAVLVSSSLSSYTRDFEEGRTTYVKSQPLGGQEFDLFRFHTRGHGLTANNDVKVQIGNIKPSPNPTSTPYGTFDVIVRDWNDTDKRPVTVEAFVGCTMDPASDNYILKRIGDQVELFDTIQRKFIQLGTWPAKSKKVWVELPNYVTPPPEALPWGFRGYPAQVFTAVSGAVSTNSPVVPGLPYVQTQKDVFGNVDPNTCWGVQFASGGIESRMKPLTDGVETYAVGGGAAVTFPGPIASDSDFTLANLTASYLNGRQLYAYVPGFAAATASQAYAPVYASASLQKFVMPLRGGHDGWDIRVPDPLYLNNSDDESVLGVVSLKRAIDTISNPDAFDMNLLVIPDIDNLKVTDYARTMVNNRQDAMYVMDVTGASVTEVVGLLQARNLDDNYTAVYYPDLKLNDTINKKIVRVGASVAIGAAIAYSDRVAQPWFAPAGLNRGGLKQFDIVDVQDRLTFDDRNTLYDNRINPIATFPDTGISVFGQKTLQVKASALDRVNVRRLLIFAKKTVASAAKYLVFEQNNPVTWDRFTKMVNPILSKIQQDQGLNRFKVVMDSSTNTADVVDQNRMVGKIFLQPTKAAEFLDISFIVTAQGVQFGS